MKTFVRPQFTVLRDRLVGPRLSIQAVIGPRQVGKTTLVRQVLERSAIPYHFASADLAGGLGSDWIGQQWSEATRISQGAPAVLVLDEIQKVPGWSDLVKHLWDEDTRQERSLQVVLLGSSLRLINAGLHESLAGRFELIRMPHWSFAEMSEAFGWDLDTYIFHGGFPGSNGRIEDFQRWRQYILDSMLEPVIGRDILLTTRIDKPVLLRQVVGLACEYSGRALSYTKMLGQLQDFGNVTTMAHYLDVLGGVGLVSGLKKYSVGSARQRGSSPKLQVWNTAYQSAVSNHTPETARADHAYWGHLVESAVGAHLLNSAWGSAYDVFYWAEGNREVDFVLHRPGSTTGLEVKSGRPGRNARSLAAFRAQHSGARTRQVGPDPANLLTFFTSGIDQLP